MLLLAVDQKLHEADLLLKRLGAEAERAYLDDLRGQVARSMECIQCKAYQQIVKTSKQV